MFSARKLFGLLLAVCLGLGTTAARAADSWLMSGHDAQATHFNAGEHQLSAATVPHLHVVWRQPRVISAIATDKNVFAVVSGPEPNVEILDVAGGKVLRKPTAANLRESGQAGGGAQALAYAQGRLIVGTSAAVMALNPVTGRLDWRAPGGASVLTVKDGIIYTGKGCQNTPAICGTMASYAITVANGKVQWRHLGNGGALPVLLAGRLYQPWGMYMPATRVYDPGSGQLLATLPLTASWTGDASKSYADVVGGPGGKPDWLGEIAANGKPVWKLPLGHVPGTGQPALAYGTLFLPSNRYHPGVIAVSAADGRVRWGADVGPNVTLAVANHLVYVLHTQSGALDILDATAGRSVARLSIPGYAGYGSLFISGGTVYVISGAGLTALRP